MLEKLQDGFGSSTKASPGSSGVTTPEDQTNHHLPSTSIMTGGYTQQGAISYSLENNPMEKQTSYDNPLPTGQGCMGAGNKESLSALKLIYEGTLERILLQQ